jgi:hypothetical protein
MTKRIPTKREARSTAAPEVRSAAVTDREARSAAVINQTLQQNILKVLTQLSSLDSEDGRVPLSQVRREVAALSGAAGEAFNRAILDLEEKGQVRLFAVRFPALFADGAGIEAGDRGLLYYAAIQGADS